MTASDSNHEASESFMRRALHLARREMEEHPGKLPISVMQMSMYLLFRAGASAADIAAIMEYERRHIAMRLMACMAALGAVTDARRARIENLVAEMGRINFEARDGCLVRFPGPSRLSHRFVEGL